ncbi:MAG TPA: hypothetical protein VH184_18810 [Dongiaceae bacterium]|nr:hypothetical protein [Dongiaceae bacterium]
MAAAEDQAAHAGEMTNARSPRLRWPLAAILLLTTGLLMATGASALDLRRAENVGGLHLRIPIEYLAGGHDDEEFLLAVHWPSMMPAADEVSSPPSQDILFIGGDEDQLALALPARFETMRRYVGAAPKAAGERFGLQLFPRDAALSQGHYDPHLDLFAHVEGGEVRSVIICDPDGSELPPNCHDELVFQHAHITLSFAKLRLAEWHAMETRSQQLLLSFSRE